MRLHRLVAWIGRWKTATNNITEQIHHVRLLGYIYYFYLMKRDIALIKDLLCHLENSDTIFTEILLENYSPFPNYPDEVVSYHLELLFEAEYVTGLFVVTNDVHKMDWSETKLTWQGHEFLSLLKNKEVINKITSLSKDGLSSMSLGVLKDVAKKLIESKAEKLLGLSK